MFGRYNRVGGSMDMLCKFFPYGDTCMENMQDGLRGQVQPIIGHKVLVRHPGTHEE